MRGSTKYARFDYLDPSKALTLEEIKQLRETVKREANKARRRGTCRAITNEMLIELMLETGLRAQEVCHLKLRDLPTHHGRDAVLVRKNTGRLLRVVDVKKELRARLHDYIKRCRPGSKPGSNLFASEAGYRILVSTIYRRGKVIKIRERTARMSYATLYRKVKFVGRLAGIERLHPHILRHTYASHLYLTEKNLRTVQDELGHSSLQHLMRYTKVFDHEKRRQIEALYRVNENILNR